MNDPTLSILENTAAIMDAMFGKPKLHTLEEDQGAPNEAHYADRATWICVCDEYERTMELAAGEACCSDEATPEQIEAFANYEAALAAVRKARG